MRPIDFKNLFGDRYRITLDPAAKFEPGGRHDPWQYVLPCRYGEIYPFDDRLLAVMVVGGRKVPEMRELGLAYQHDGDGEAAFLFTPDQFEEVAQIVQPRKRRQVSPANRKAARERAVANRIWEKTKSPAQLTGRQGQFAA